MIKFSQKNFYLILIFDSLLIAMVGLLIWQIVEERNELTKSLTETSLSKSVAGELSSGSWPKLQTKLALLDEHFLSASTTVELLELLENTAKQTKTNFKINQAEAKDNLWLNFSVQGSFLAVNQFLILLEQFPYALRLERLDLRAGDKDEWRGDFVVTINIYEN